MSRAWSFAERWLAAGVIAWAVSGAIACGERESATSSSNGAPGNSEPRSLCPDCPDRAGGESSDFGTPHPCSAAEQQAAIGRERAAELAFDAEVIESLVERSFRAPLRWTPHDSTGLPHTRGYETETAIEGDVTVESYRYVSLDPALCQGNDCTINGEAYECSDRLILDVAVHLRTLDGAIEADMLGYVLVGRPGFPFSEYPAGTVFASLSEVTGSLDLPTEALSRPRATLLADLFYKPEDVEGDVRVELFQASSPTSGRAYYPISGHWPDPR